ncbi:hypothetical protein ERO13_A07G168000v2 [Gossypium hirsutum]|uniref:Phytosulfokine-beta n=3 Tax=Gossypium TaxID=3633 RepID=A0A5J5V596_GOSBA|nr:hypothetical protein ES319_A07G186900v1 [Gossypium barbadense]KAG4192704.1 hypothetical protein ERO13_A07G168000v2 [Gossypium hirsutum]TYH10766.1 hypothetical protein ES288_A07G203000v1 [Gossypium darwinii]TYI19958.1 hypothetical protein ES332_A07G200700v1 [Gossypium tomentosum]
MAVPRRMIIFIFITLILGSFLVKSSNADGCNHDNPDESQRSCADVPEDEDDFDDTYKVVDNKKISSEMIIVGK